MNNRILCSIFSLLLLSGGVWAQAPADVTSVQPQLVDSYHSLADTILGAKRTERNLVLSILATTYNHARATYGQAAASLEADRDASAELEKLAALVSQLGNEGDAAVAAVRKRLLEGGHHHNAAGEQQGIYDPGFVIVTRAAKKTFLDAAREIGRLSRSPDPDTLRRQWGEVSAQYASLIRDE